MIGIIDSGIGGLAVVDALMQLLPRQDLVYFGDTAHAPIGNRSPARIVDHALQSAEFLRRFGIDTLVLASHTLSCVAFDELAKRFEGSIFDVATLAAEMAAEASLRARIGLVASRATVESARYEKLICERRPQAEVYGAACPLWTPLVEEGWLKRRETAMIVKRGLLAIRARQVDVLILGSSYFKPLRRVIQRKMGPRVTLVEPSELLAARVADHVMKRAEAAERTAGRRQVRLLVSDLTSQVARTAQFILGRPVALEAAF